MNTHVMDKHETLMFYARHQIYNFNLFKIGVIQRVPEVKKNTKNMFTISG